MLPKGCFRADPQVRRSKMLLDPLRKFSGVYVWKRHASDAVTFKSCFSLADEGERPRLMLPRRSGIFGSEQGGGGVSQDRRVPYGRPDWISAAAQQADSSKRRFGRQPKERRTGMSAPPAERGTFMKGGQ